MINEKQQKILQMAKDICRVKLNCNDVCKPVSACDALKYAERAVEAGYSKPCESTMGQVKRSEVAREIFAEIESCLDYIEEQLDDIPDAFLCVKDDIAELKKKYTEGLTDEKI